MAKKKKIPPEKLYAEHIKASIEWLKAIAAETAKSQGRLFPQKSFESLYGNKVATRVGNIDEIDFSTGRIAVVVVGYTSSGRNAFVREFVSKHPEFASCNYDRAELSMYIKYAESKVDIKEAALDQIGLFEFGYQLAQIAKMRKNVIVNGQYASLNARGALLNTLRDLGYDKIIVCNTLSRKKETEIEHISRAALEMMYLEWVCENYGRLEYLKAGLRIIDEDCINNMIQIKPIEKWTATKRFKEIQAMLAIEHYQKEPKENDKGFQDHYGCYGRGADIVVDV